MSSFLSRNYLFAVVGVSANPEKYGYRIFHDLQHKGFEVVGVNPKITRVGETPIFAHLKNIKPLPDVVIIVTPPSVSQMIVKDANALGINKIWFQPGSFNEEILNYCAQNDIKTVAGACIMLQ